MPMPLGACPGKSCRSTGSFPVRADKEGLHGLLQEPAAQHEQPQMP
jgi:hypothetical protein